MISIVGSTGAGKTALALKLSKYLPINVISADSRQVYKYMDIWTWIYGYGYRLATWYSNFVWQFCMVINKSL